MPCSGGFMPAPAQREAAGEACCCCALQHGALLLQHDAALQQHMPPCCRCRCTRGRRASPLTCLAICFLLLTYNLLGGFLFLAIEGQSASPETAVAASKPNPSRALGAGDELRSETVERLWSITEDLNILYKENWTKLAAKELMDFQQVLVQSMRGSGGGSQGGGGGGSGGGGGADYRWTFSGSFLYALTLITTIGHGNVTPKSPAGKLASVAYACVGIPLVMLYLSTVGAALARRARAAWGRVRGPGRERGRAGPEPPRRTPFQAALNLASVPRRARGRGAPAGRVPSALSAALLALYVCAGAALFARTERWDAPDAAYFAFCSLATVGFGELRPGRHARAISPRAEDAAVGACCAYILVGVALVAMCFELIREDAGALLHGISALCAGAGARPAAPAPERDAKLALVS